MSELEQLKKEAREGEVIKLAMQLYNDLPWWKKKRVAYWYKKNNWDVTRTWEKCVYQARRMIEEGEVWTR